MTDMNKPVKITHDPDTGDILSRENSGIDPVKVESTERLRRNAERKRIEAQKAERSRQWREEAMETPEEYMVRTNSELRERAIAEEDAAKPKGTIHAYPYAQTELMTIDEVKKESGAGVIVNGEPANYGDYYKPVAPKPSQVHFKPSPEKVKELAEAFKPIQKGFKKLGKSAKQATKALEKLPPTGTIAARGTNLQHRPFHNLEMIVFRDSLEENQ